MEAAKTAKADLRFSQWLRHPMLLAKLIAVGYPPGQRLYPPLQVGVIVGHLGEP